MDELDYFPALLKSIEHYHDSSRLHLYVCVNQPESFWNDQEKISICQANNETLKILESFTFCSLTVINRSSKGLGWSQKKQGVGWARKLLMDKIASEANSEDILLSLDADTVFRKNYFDTILSVFDNNPKAIALSVPYFHNLTGDEKSDRAMLRYECYMRYYAINMFRIKNPFAFTALGSAIALRVSAYQAIRGVSPRPSGEDFYLLQKLVKYGKISHYCSEKVFPATRVSERVPFGTGPAISKGISGDWESYPFYPISLFGEIEKSCAAFPELFSSDISTPMDVFFEKRMNGNIWTPLRKNSKNVKQFVRACYQKVDGLRILQFLRFRMSEIAAIDEIICLQNLLEIENEKALPSNFSFSKSTIEEVDNLRKLLEKIEIRYRKENSL